MEIRNATKCFKAVVIVHTEVSFIISIVILYFVCGGNRQTDREDILLF
jgi:hypothetical protein